MKGASSAQVLRHGVFAVAVGVVGAAASVVLCLVVGWAYDLVCAHGWLLYLLPIFAVASLLLYRALRLPLDTTTHTVINDICVDRPISPALAPGILLGTALSILGGASVGKEAAALHMGASLGDLVARPLKLRPLTGVWKGGSRADGAGGTSGGDGAVGSAGASGGAGIGGGASGGVHAYAASCGMAACFAALFFAPLGSTAFVIELSRYDRSVWRHAPFMLLACFVAFGLASIIGIGDVIPKVPLPALSWPVVGQCVVIAVACALVGTVYIQIIDGAQRLTKRISQNYYLWAALGGVLMAVLVTLFDWRGFEGTGRQPALRRSGRPRRRVDLRREGAAHHRVPRALAARRRDHAHLHRGRAARRELHGHDPGRSGLLGGCGARRLLRRHEPLPGDRLPHGLRDFRLGRCARVRFGRGRLLLPRPRCGIVRARGHRHSEARDFGGAGAPCREEAVTAGEFVGNCPCGAACGWVSYQIVRLQKKL